MKKEAIIKSVNLNFSRCDGIFFALLSNHEFIKRSSNRGSFLQAHQECSSNIFFISFDAPLPICPSFVKFGAKALSA